MKARHGPIEVRRIDAAKEVAGRARAAVTYLPSGGQGGGSNLLLGLSDR